MAEAMAAQNAPRTAARHDNLQESFLASDGRSSRGSRRDRTDPAPRVVPQQPVTHRSPWIFAPLITIVQLGWRAASGLFRTFLYVLAFLPASLRPRVVTQRISTGLMSTNGRRMLMPRDAAARFKREFDEAYGANDLPFFEGGIAQAHDLAKKELKFLLVVLMSPEHDDAEAFAKDTLLDAEVVNYVKDPTNNIILWGGNILDSETYQVAEEYNCTKFPFSALACLTPKEGSTRMGIIKRLVGPMPANTYVSELRGAMEKYGPELSGVRAERTAQQMTRNIRTEQDSAYERSLAIDRERARQRKEAAAAEASAEKRALEKAEEAARLAELRKQWKSWRAARVMPEPPAGDTSVVRVALKMPESSGAGRITRRFPQDAPMEELYAFVECHDVLQDGEAAAGGPEPAGYSHQYTFRIASTLPREVYEPSTSATMGNKIGRSGNLIVEPLADSDGSDDSEGDDDDDEDDD